MKQFLLSFTLLLLTFTVDAQRVELRWSPETKYNKQSADLGYVGRVGEYYYSLRKEDKVVYLSKSRIKTMSQAWEKAIRWNDIKRSNSSDKNLSYYSFRKFRDHFVFYFEDFNKEEDRHRLYAQKISFEGEPTGDLVELGTREKQRRSKNGSFSLRYAKDSLHSLLVINPYYEKYKDELFEFKVFDQDLGLINNFKVQLPFRDKDFDVKSFTLVKGHTIYLLGSVELSKREREDGQPQFNYKILKIDVASAKANLVDIPFKGKYVDVIELVVDDHENVRCAGFYGDLKPNGKVDSGAKGLFYLTLDDASDKISYHPFDDMMIREIGGKKNERKGDGLGYFFGIKYAFTRPDGGMVLLFEDRRVRTVTTTNSRGQSTTTYHYFDMSILQAEIDANGDIKRYVHIPKKQHTVNDGGRFNSFHAMYVNGSTYIIYNDHESNAIIKGYDKTMNNSLKAVPVIVTITASGHSSKKALTENIGKSEFTLIPTYADKISESEAFFYAHNYSKACCVIGGRKIKTKKVGILSIR